MAEQAWRVRRRLRGLGGEISVSWLAADLGIPAPSVRRSLSELRKLGFVTAVANGTAVVVRDPLVRERKYWRMIRTASIQYPYRIEGRRAA